MDDKPIGKAKRDIEEGEVIQFTITGNKVTSPDIKLNKHGKAYILGETFGGEQFTLGDIMKKRPKKQSARKFQPVPPSKSPGTPLPFGECSKIPKEDK